ncbi:MAG: hypothetical protein R2756_11675 [Bacteroidales bacterium]
MLSGIGAALLLPALNLELLQNWPLTENFSMNAFPVIFLISLAGSILGSLLTKKEDDETLKKFYRQVRPWGFWKPVERMVVAEDPAFRANAISGRICSILQWVSCGRFRSWPSRYSW